MISRPDKASRDTPVPEGAWGERRPRVSLRLTRIQGTAALEVTAWMPTSDLAPRSASSYQFIPLDI